MPLSEDGILTIIDRYFSKEHPSLLLGRGDDCAVLRGGGSLAVSTDIFAEHAHYRRRYFSPRHIGYKALAVNVSDIAASGASPEGFSIGLTLTGDEDESWLMEFCEGIKEVADQFALAVSGGDLSRGPVQSVCITAWGRLPDDLPLGLRRGMAREGDIVFVCGNLGLARAGLTVLEETAGSEDVSEALRVWPQSCLRHLRPLPLAAAGGLLARFAVSHGLGDRMGLMDVSDGLARDLPRLLGSGSTGLGADIFLAAEMLPPEVLRFTAERGIDAAMFAYGGGEDYALAGTCPAYAWPEVGQWMEEGGYAVAEIGTVHRGETRLNGTSVEETGFDHFA